MEISYDAEGSRGENMTMTSITIVCEYENLAMTSITMVCEYENLATISNNVRD